LIVRAALHLVRRRAGAPQKIFWERHLTHAWYCIRVAPLMLAPRIKEYCLL
jgi:hypothetical protein